jgi:hypothetical protein
MILLGGRDEVAGLVCVELQRPSKTQQISFQNRHVLGCRIAPHKPGEQTARGIVDHFDQVDPFSATLQPVVRAGVPLHQFAESLPALPPLVDLG